MVFFTRKKKNMRKSDFVMQILLEIKIHGDQLQGMCSASDRDQFLGVVRDNQQFPYPVPSLNIEQHKNAHGYCNC